MSIFEIFKQNQEDGFLNKEKLIQHLQEQKVQYNEYLIEKFDKYNQQNIKFIGQFENYDKKVPTVWYDMVYKCYELANKNKIQDNQFQKNKLSFKLGNVEEINTKIQVTKTPIDQAQYQIILQFESNSQDIKVFKEFQKLFTNLFITLKSVIKQVSNFIKYMSFTYEQQDTKYYIKIQLKKEVIVLYQYCQDLLQKLLNNLVINDQQIVIQSDCLFKNLFQEELSFKAEFLIQILQKSFQFNFDLEANVLLQDYFLNEQKSNQILKNFKQSRFFQSQNIYVPQTETQIEQFQDQQIKKDLKLLGSFLKHNEIEVEFDGFNDEDMESYGFLLQMLDYTPKRIKLPKQIPLLQKIILFFQQNMVCSFQIDCKLLTDQIYIQLKTDQISQIWKNILEI